MIKIAYLILLLPLYAAASDGQDIQEWWDNEYKTKIQPEQIANENERINSRCDDKIEYYTQKLNEYPKDIFYKWRLDIWTKRCK